MTSRKQVRWGILGTGWVAQRFMADLRGVRDAEPSAVASRTESRAQEVAARFGVRRAHSSYRALLEDPELDVIYVATSPNEHAEHCLAALHNGKHVLCEKPFAVSTQETTVVIEKARSARLFCMEAMWTRFLPAIIQTMHHVDAGDIGVPRVLTADFGIPMVDSGSSRLFDFARGGGSLLDRGVYAISLAVCLFGKPQRIWSHANLSASGSDAAVSAILEFADSKSAVIGASLTAYSGNEAVIAGSTGRIRIHEPFYRAERVTISRAPTAAATKQSDLNPGSLKEHARRLVSRAKPYLPADIHRSTVLRCPIHGYGYGYEAAEVVRCVQEGLTESPVLPLHNSQLTMEAVQEIRRQTAHDGTDDVVEAS
jgi:predicted dehydrogenase